MGFSGLTIHCKEKKIPLPYRDLNWRAVVDYLSLGRKGATRNLYGVKVDRRGLTKRNVARSSGRNFSVKSNNLSL